MHTIITIARKELSIAWRSIAYYFIFAIFLATTGAIFSSTLFKLGKAELRSLFSIIHLIFLFYIPALTMGSLAREKSTGTFEILSVAPIRLSSIVWAKFLAVWSLVFMALLFTFINIFILMLFGTGIDYGAILCGYLGLFLVGGVYTAIGIFASSIQTNQILAFIIALLLGAVLYLVQYILPLIPQSVKGIFQFISMDFHYQSFLKGVIDTRDLVFMFSLIVGFIILAELNLKSHNTMVER